MTHVAAFGTRSSNREELLKCQRWLKEVHLQRDIRAANRVLKELGLRVERTPDGVLHLLSNAE